MRNDALGIPDLLVGNETLPACSRTRSCAAARTAHSQLSASPRPSTTHTPSLGHRSCIHWSAARTAPTPTPPHRTQPRTLAWPERVGTSPPCLPMSRRAALPSLATTPRIHPRCTANVLCTFVCLPPSLACLQHRAAVNHLVYTPDGRRLLCAGNNGNVSLWNGSNFENELGPGIQVGAGGWAIPSA